MEAADTGEQKYFIFRYLCVYEANEKEAIEKGNDEEDISLCKNVIDEDNIWDGKIQNICEQFIKYFIFSSKNGNNMGVQKEDYCIEYFNYWLNDKLRSHVELSENRSKIYKHFESFFNTEGSLSKLKNKINNIQDNYYNKMNSMYKLYDNYNKIKNIEYKDVNKEKNCLDYANNCVREYSKYIYECYEKKDDKFCEALKEFEYIYRTSKYNFKGCKTIDLPRLPEFKNVEDSKKVKSPNKFSICSVAEHNSGVHSTQGEYEIDSILSELSLLKTYEEFNSDRYSSEFNEYCSKIKPSIDDRCENYILCAKIETNLKKLHKMEGNKDNNEHCLYFTYWLYDQISKTFSNNSNYIVDIPDVNNLFEVIYKINHKFEKNKKCYVDYRHKAKVGELKEMKHMHDYFMVFENLKKYSPYKNESRQKCCDYVKHINVLYKKYIGNCCICYFRSKECHNNCDYFKCDQSYNPYELYKEFECDKLEDKGKRFERVGKPTAIDYYVIRLSSLKLQCNTIFCDLFYVFVLAAFFVLGLFFVFFIFYKFTPLGPRFEKWTINKKRIQNVIHEEEMREMVSRGSNDRKKKPPPQRIHLAYQSEG